MSLPIGFYTDKQGKRRPIYKKELDIRMKGMDMPLVIQRVSIIEDKSRYPNISAFGSHTVPKPTFIDGISVSDVGMHIGSFSGNSRLKVIQHILEEHKSTSDPDIKKLLRLTNDELISFHGFDNLHKKDYEEENRIYQEAGYV